MEQGPRLLATEEAERRRIAAELSEVALCLPGSIATRQLRCGQATCRCKADPPVLHGPYHHWTRKIGGKTVGRYLSDEQLARYGDWFSAARRYRDLLYQLEALSLRIAERTEGWDSQPPPKGHQEYRRGSTSRTDKPSRKPRS
jgi:hypothetical protein